MIVKRYVNNKVEYFFLPCIEICYLLCNWHASSSIHLLWVIFFDSFKKKQVSVALLTHSCLSSFLSNTLQTTASRFYALLYYGTSFMIKHFNESTKDNFVPYYSLKTWYNAFGYSKSLKPNYQSSSNDDCSYFLFDNFPHPHPKN